MSNFFNDIGLITWFVLGWLSIYFIANIWIFIWRFFKLNEMLSIEKEALDSLSSDRVPMYKSMYRSTFFSIIDRDKEINKDMIHIHKLKATKQITVGLSMLSIISSTAPFIGLFGTVVEILEAFYHLSGDGRVSFDVIAPIISKALIATAFGILTAIPAYSFYIILRRKAYEVSTYLDMQISLILNIKKHIDTKISLR